MSFQQQHSNDVHYGRGSKVKGMHFYLTIQRRELQNDELMLPRNFVDKYWRIASNPISLLLPNGSACKINWEQRGGDIWILNWKRFAQSLRCGDLLVLQYKGESDFHVIILDDSQLEIDYSCMRFNDDGQDEESDDDDCVVIPNDIATTSAAPHGTKINKRKINMNATKQKVSFDEGAEVTDESESRDDEATEKVQESDESSDESSYEEESDESSDESSYEDEMAKQARRTRKGKRKMSMDFDTTQPKFSGSNKVAMVNKAGKYSTSRTVNENPFFEITMSQSYTNGHHLWIPSQFSREHLKDFNGTATIRVGNERSVEVTLRYYDTQKNTFMGGGWKIFTEKYNLQVDDHCKFEMIQQRPISFIVTITRAGNEPVPMRLQGYKKGVSGGDNSVLKKQYIGGTSRSHPKGNFLEAYEASVLN